MNMSEEVDINVETLDEDESLELDNSHSLEPEPGNLESEQGNADERKTKNNIDNENKTKILRLPINRIKQIMKSDPDCSIVSPDAVVLVVKATEMFIEFLGKEAVKHTSKRKTLLKRDVDTVIDTVPHLCFLEGALDWQ